MIVSFSSTPVLAIATAFHGFPFGGRTAMPPWAFPVSLFPLPATSSSSWVIFTSQCFYPKGLSLCPLSGSPFPLGFVSSAWRACAALHEDFLLPRSCAGVHNDRGVEHFPALRQPSAELGLGPMQASQEKKINFPGPSLRLSSEKPTASTSRWHRLWKGHMGW